MMLTLRNGYPMPDPSKVKDAQTAALVVRSSSVSVELAGVVSLEWLYGLTVRFKDVASMRAAQATTAWNQYDERPILEVVTSEADGYEHPALCAKGTAYCGFFLSA